MMVSRRTFSKAAGAALMFGFTANGAFADDTFPTHTPSGRDDLADTIRATMAAGHKGLRLADGHYGPQTIRSLNAGKFSIVGNGGAILDMTMIADSSGLDFSGVAFRGTKTERGSGAGLCYVTSGSSAISFENCSFATVDNADQWTANDWIERPYLYGLFARGQHITASNCQFFNLRNCTSFIGDDGKVLNCTFKDFGNDGIDFGANRIKILGNSIAGSHHTELEKLHSDGIQGFPAPDEGMYEDIEIADNDIKFVGPGDYMQGICIFDGRWSNMRIRNNTVAVNLWNAIAVYGVDDVLVEGNVVRSLDPKRKSWIEVRASKTKREPKNAVVRNNRSSVFRLPAKAVSENNVPCTDSSCT